MGALCKTSTQGLPEVGNTSGIITNALGLQEDIRDVQGALEVFRIGW